MINIVILAGVAGLAKYHTIILFEVGVQTVHRPVYIFWGGKRAKRPKMLGDGFSYSAANHSINPG